MNLVIFIFPVMKIIQKKIERKLEGKFNIIKRKIKYDPNKLNRRLEMILFLIYLQCLKVH